MFEGVKNADGTGFFICEVDGQSCGFAGGMTSCIILGCHLIWHPYSSLNIDINKRSESAKNRCIDSNIHSFVS